MGQISLSWVGKEQVPNLYIVLEAYKAEEQVEEPYYSFIKRTLKDAQNGLVACITIHLENKGIIGFSAISCSAVHVGECRYNRVENRVEYSLYKEHDLLPAVQLDLFVLVRNYRGKGYGREALDELLKYLMDNLRSKIGFRYITTLSTSQEFTNLAKKFGFEYLRRGIDIDNLKQHLEMEDPYLFNVVDEHELIEKAKELKKLEGVWLFLDCEQSF